MKVVLAAKPWTSDLSLHQIPWRDNEDHIYRDGKKKLTVGVLWDDGVVKPAPPVTRALQETVNRMKSVPDIEVVEWKPYQQKEALEILVSVLWLGLSIWPKSRCTPTDQHVNEDETLCPGRW
jgi:hypothetical protein